MDIYDALGKLAGPLERRMGYEVTAAVLDGICELPTRREMECAVCWLARDYGLLEMIGGEEVETETRAALQVA